MPRLLVVVSLILVAGLSACGDSDKKSADGDGAIPVKQGEPGEIPKDWKNFDERDVRFTFHYPPWMKLQRVEGKPILGESGRKVMCQPDEAPSVAQDLEGVIREQEKAVREEDGLRPFDVRIENTPTGHVGRMEIKPDDQNDPPGHALFAIFLLTSNVGRILCVARDPQDLDHRRDDLDRMMRTIRF